MYEHEKDRLYLEDCLIIPRHDTAIHVGIDFPSQDKVTIRDVFIGRGAAPAFSRSFWKRPRLRRLLPPLARLGLLGLVWRATR